MRILIKNATIITQNKNRKIIPFGFIIINNDRIVKIGNGTPLIKKGNYSKIINASNLIILPGLINAHVHLGESAYQKLFKGSFDLEDYLQTTEEITRRTNLIEKERKTIANYSLLQLLKSNTTTIAGGRTRESAEFLGMRNISGYMVMDSFKLRQLSINLEKNFLKEYKKIKKNKLCRPALFLHSLNWINPKVLPVVKKLLKKFPDLLLFIHIAETKLQEQEIKKKFGLSSVAVLKKNCLLNKQTVLVHGNWLNSNDFELIKKNRAALVHCLSSNLRVADRHLNLKEVLQKKIPACLATDGIVTSRAFNILEETQRCFRYYKQNNQPISFQSLLDLITIIDLSRLT